MQGGGWDGSIVRTVVELFSRVENLIFDRQDSRCRENGEGGAIRVLPDSRRFHCNQHTVMEFHWSLESRTHATKPYPMAAVNRQTTTDKPTNKARSGVTMHKIYPTFQSG